MDRVRRLTVGLIAGFWILSPVSSLSQSQAAPKPAAVDPVKRGEAWFYQRCSLCHLGRVLKNERLEPMAKGLSGLFRDAPPAREAAVRNIIRSGNPRMPGFQYLDPNQLDDLIAYLKTL